MSINKSARIVIMAILSFAFTIIFCILLHSECLAAGFSVNVDNPKWTYDTFSYETVSISDASSTHITTLTIYADDGYIESLPAKVNGVDITWHKDIGTTVNGKTVYNTALCVLGNGSTPNSDFVTEIIKNVNFMLKDYATTIKVTVMADARDTELPTVQGGYRVTRGTGSFADHYYVFIPQVLTWAQAYKAARETTLMGYRGYLVTVTDRQEDIILNKINDVGAWAGGIRVNYEDYTYDYYSTPGDESTKETKTATKIDNDAIKVMYAAGEWSNVKIPEKAEHSVWKWVCGPEGEIGTEIKITGSWSDTNYGVKDPGTGYSNWNRNDTVANAGNEPNNYPYTNSENGEYCLSVHYGEKGEQAASLDGVKPQGWNDLPNDATSDQNFVSGYFVEFDGFVVDVEKTAVKESAPSYSHTLKYEAVKDANNNIVGVKVTCTNPSHIECEYKGTPESTHSLVLSINKNSCAYTGDPTTVAVTNAKLNGVSKDSSYLSSIGVTQVGGIVYEGINGTTYGPSATAPTNAGSYVAKATFRCGNPGAYEDFEVEKEFSITPAPLTITLKDQTVVKDQNIDKTTVANVVDMDPAKTTGLISPALIYSIAVTADTSTVGVAVADIDLDNSVSPNIVIKSGAEDVTSNYSINIVKAKVTVTSKTPIVDTPVSVSEIIYGQSLGDSKIEGKYKDPDTGREVKGTFTWTTPAVKPEVSDSNTTDYEITFAPQNLTDYKKVVFNSKVTVNKKDIGSSDINRAVLLTINNNALVSLKDTQTGNDLASGTDYTVTQSIVGQKVKVTISGIGNYKGSFEVYLDAHVWTGRLITDVTVDSSADELLPKAGNVELANGYALLSSKVNDPSLAYSALAKSIVNDIIASGSSTTGDFKSLVTLLISNADQTISAAEKSCALSAIGAPALAGESAVPSDATVGLYFDVSMNIQYLIEQQNPTTLTLVDDMKEIIDTSSAVLSNGFSERVQITVPDRLRPAKGYSRTYYIIRVHDDGSHVLKYSVLPVTRNGYDLTFYTDKFSKYAIVYTETKDAQKKSEVSNESNDNTQTTESSSSSQTQVISYAQPAPTQTSVAIVAPKTGESGILDIAIIIIFAGVLLLFYAIYRKEDAR